MHSFIRSSLLLAVISDIALADNLATIDACSQDTANPLVTVSTQYQPVSTCVPVVQSGVTSLSYSTYDYVSTTVSYKPDGTSTSEAVITDTAQWMVVTKYPETTETGALQARGVSYETISKRGLAVYKNISDWAIPDWSGSGLCKDCMVVDSEGCRHQKIYMQECRQKSNTRKCIEYEQWWTSSPVPQATTVQYAGCGTRVAVDHAGTYTWAFPQPAITKYIEHHGQVITAHDAPWTAYVTRACGGPTVFEFITTITKTCTLRYPWWVGPPTGVVTVTNPPPTGYPHPHWPGHPGRPGGGPGNGGGPISGGPPVTGPFTTLTVTPGASNIGTIPATVTVALPSGTVPGTIIVLDPSATGTASIGPAPTGPFVSITVTATGNPGVTGTVTITIATPSGTSPGTVVIVDPPLISGSGSTTTTPSTTNTFGPVSTTSSTTGTITSLTPTTVTTGGAIPGTTCAGLVCIVVTASLPLGTASAGVTVLPNGSTSTLPGTTQTITTGGPIPGTTCAGLVCVVVSATFPVDIGVSATVLPATTTTPTTQTITTSGPIAGTTCAGLVCVVVAVPSFPVISSIGVGLTVLPDGSTSTLPPTTQTITTTGPIAGTTCQGLVCLVVSATVPVIGPIGAGATVIPTTTVTTTGPVAGTTCAGAVCFLVNAVFPSVATAGVGLTVLPDGSTSTLPPTTQTITTTGPIAGTTCQGLVCLVVSASLPVVGGIGAGATVVPTTTVTTTGPVAGTTCAGLVCFVVNAAFPSIAGVSAGATVLPQTVTTGGPVAGTTCQGVVCVVVTASLPVVGGIGAGVTAVPTTTVTTTGPVAGTTCAGLVCFVVNAAFPSVAGVSAGATVLPNGSTVTQPTTQTVTTGGPVAGTTCQGLVCVVVTASLPVVGNLGAGATVLPATTTPPTTQTITTTGPVAGTTCQGLVCIVVNAAAAPVLSTVAAGITVLPNGNTVTAAGTQTIVTGGPVAGTTCAGLLCVVVTATFPIVGGLGLGGTVLPTTTAGGFRILNINVGSDPPAATTTTTVAAQTTTTPNVGGGQPVTTTTQQPAAPAPTTTTSAARAGTTTTQCNGLACVNVGVSVAGVGASVGATVLGNGGTTTTTQPAANPAPTTTTTPRVANAASTTTTAAQRTTLATTTTRAVAAQPTCVGILCISISPKNKRAEQAIAQAPEAKRYANLCSSELNICAGLNLNTLFSTQRCVLSSRLGCLLSNVLNRAAETCQGSNCSTFGVTGDGSLGLTSTLTIADIQARIDSFAEANGGVCNVGQIVKLRSSAATCRS